MLGFFLDRSCKIIVAWNAARAVPPKMTDCFCKMALSFSSSPVTQSSYWQRFVRTLVRYLQLQPSSCHEGRKELDRNPLHYGVVMLWHLKPNSSKSKWQKKTSVIDERWWWCQRKSLKSHLPAIDRKMRVIARLFLAHDPTIRRLSITVPNDANYCFWQCTLYSALRMDVYFVFCTMRKPTLVWVWLGKI